MQEKDKNWFYFIWQPKAGLAYSVSYTYNRCYTRQNKQSKNKF